jgi:hypothetical protein
LAGVVLAGSAAERYSPDKKRAARAVRTSKRACVPNMRHSPLIEVGRKILAGIRHFPSRQEQLQSFSGGHFWQFGKQY